MREICSYGSVGERGGNEPLYPEIEPLYASKDPETGLKLTNLSL